MLIAFFSPLPLYFLHSPFSVAFCPTCFVINMSNDQRNDRSTVIKRTRRVVTSRIIIPLYLHVTIYTLQTGKLLLDWSKCDCVSFFGVETRSEFFVRNKKFHCIIHVDHFVRLFLGILSFSTKNPRTIWCSQ